MRASPSSRVVVERIFAEIGEPSTAYEAVSVMKRAYETLAGVMTPIVGEAGVQAIFVRGLRKCRTTYSCLEAVVARDRDAFLDQLWTSLKQEKPAIIKDIGIALLTSFSDVLSNLIGDELTLKLFRNGWPDASASAADEAKKS
jgi:hypothetical protein